METMREIAALVAVLALVGAAGWVFGRRAGAAPGAGVRRLERLEKLLLSPQHTLHLIRLEERILLVASFPNGCTLLESRAAGDGERRGEARP